MVAILQQQGGDIKATFRQAGLRKQSIPVNLIVLTRDRRHRYTLMLVLLDTGIRVDELCHITVDDIHEGYIKIQGKGKKEREAGISPTTSKFLWKYLNLHRPQADASVKALFTNIRGLPLTPSGVEQIFDKIRDAAGVTDVLVSPHKLRHTFARTWLERGGDIYSLSRLLGHSSVKITEIYLEDFKSRQARA
jgi:site-specific recombinase XerD